MHTLGSIRQDVATSLDQDAGTPLERLASARSALPSRGGRVAAGRLRRARERIDAAYRKLSATGGKEGPESAAAEWLLDNYYVVERAYRLVREEFPREFERRLPCVIEGDLRGLPMVYVLAREALARSGYHLDGDDLALVVDEFQATRALSMAESWALPVVLRLVVLERLAASASAAAEEGDARRADAADRDEAAGQSVASCIRSLRVIETTDWREFFERINLAERELRKDPAGVYARMDFQTRDAYRKVVEELAARSDRSEVEVAREAVGRSSAPGAGEHVGYHLVGAGFIGLARHLGYRAPLRARLRQGVGRHPTAAYLGSIAALVLLHEVTLAAALRLLGGSVATTSVAAVLGLPLAVTIAVSLVNAAVTRLVPPRRLPKLDFSDGVPPEYRTVIAIPAILANAEDVSELISNAEVRWLAAADRNVFLSLLTDFGDAHAQDRPEDDALLLLLKQAVDDLNRRYGRERDAPFLLFHRTRRFNPGDRLWMGWERKRGKLVEFNRLLAGDQGTSFTAHAGDAEVLRTTRFVITLDADTEMPRESARRLVATLAHPLNQARFDEETGRVSSGYTILQPRIEVKPLSAESSRLSRTLAGDAGLDLYASAVSDVYQDLFGEGIFVGKGIYDPLAVERSLSGVVPDNALLSHDLFEGIHGRAGLVSDVVLLEDYPSDYLAYSRRLHRWARGDWQLLPWLCRRVPADGGRRVRSRLSAVSRWKIADNLRRTLIAPSLLAFLLLAWTLLPGSPIVWTVLALLALAAPALTETMGGLLTGGVAGGIASSARGAAGTLRRSGAQWLLHVVLLPHRAALLGDACLRTLHRLAVSRRRLLEWTSAAHTARALGRGTTRRRFWREMKAAPLIGLGVLALLPVVRPAALAAAAPLALAWILSPEVALWISRPRRTPMPRPPREVRRLRALARRTWLFFETFVGPDDQWLPPDHFQQEPRGEVARRTSPTNIGLLLLSVLSAYDLGYAGLLAIAVRLRRTFDGLLRMERHWGHFYNWYDTRALSPLPPRYVSTVDSGNLAAALLALEQGCHELADSPVLTPRHWAGLLDTLAVIEGVVERAAETAGGSQLANLERCIARTRREVEEALREERLWGEGVLRILDEHCPELEAALAALVVEAGGALDLDLLAELRAWSAELRSDVVDFRREIELWLPGQTFLASRPAPLAASSDGVAEAWRELERCLATVPTVRELPATYQRALSALADLEARAAACPGSVATGEATSSTRGLRSAIESAREAARGLLATLEGVAEQAQAIVQEMDFATLYDAKRELFYIGYDVSTEAFDQHHYDLLASEARLGSFVAIAKGDVPAEHWLHLGRPFGRAHGGPVLLSWSGTMFEYLLPSLLLREGDDSLIGRTLAHAVATQIAYARSRGVPWGFSESGYYRLDAQHNYQYRAFGVPQLGLKRGLEDDLVAAPYACVLALHFAPEAGLDNLTRFEKLGLAGRYGLFEAIDFTPARVPAGHDHAVVRSFMAHHQGMILCALSNLLLEDPLVRRFHASPVVKTADALLFERPVRGAPLVRTRPEAERRAQPVRHRQELEPWSPWPGEAPNAHVLSNGRYRVLVTEGGGGSSWGALALTRWHPDATLDDQGFRIYVRDADRGISWSPSFEEGTVLFRAHAAELRHHAHDVSVRQRICVAPRDDVEVRLVTVVNEAQSRRRIEVTSYAEVVLGSAEDDRRHPAFSKLFVECEYLEDLHALVFRRRRRSPGEAQGWLLHMMVLPGGHAAPSGHEVDRARFLGRGGDLRAPAHRSSHAATDATLDPILSLSGELELAARSMTTLAYLLIAGDSREAVIALARRHRSLPDLDLRFEMARRHADAEVTGAGLASDDLPSAQALLSAILHPHRAMRAPAAVLAANRLGQRSLWRFGISGDLPILLVHCGESGDVAALAWVLRAHQLWRRQGVAIDVVVLVSQPGGYAAELEEAITRTIRRSSAEAWTDRPGGIFVVRAAHLDDAERTLLLTSARVVIEGDVRAAAARAMRLSEPARLPALAAGGVEPPGAESLPRPSDLLFDNGFGGFTPDGREYVIHLEDGETTPAPWVNVIANPRFGCVISESGGGYTWAENSGENRLTPWRNDPVCDQPGEALYLRDEETAAVWSPTPRPAPARGAYQVRHGAGYTAFRHRSNGLDQELLCWVPPDDPVKIVQLRVSNRLGRPRRLTATYYAEWVLGRSRDRSQPFVITDFDHDSEALLARNPWSDELGARVAFLAASERLHGVTADRREFLGRRGGYAAPDALRRVGLAGVTQPGVDPCGALQVHVDLAPGETTELHFLVGQAAERSEALELVARYRRPEALASSWAEVGRRWDALLSAVEVRTPDPAIDVMTNRWLLYQAVASRLWGRTGYYQSSGAFGFRDQLQDVAALVHGAPELCRAHLLEAARHQFEAGDVLHWWHPPSGAGVRTRCSDDLLWLPFVTAHYVAATGDQDVLSEGVPFVAGEPLGEGQAERYGRFPATERSATLYEHCLAALLRGSTAGPNGLPLIGSGDWNDGMNRVGSEGRGESVWLGWFLHAALTRFAPLAERMGDAHAAEQLRRRASELKPALEAAAWDGAWYRRAFYDDGTALGSRRTDGRIDSIAQSWAVLSSAADADRATAAMDAARRRLVRDDERLILLLEPPFSQDAHDPGYIAAYPPGVRENGGQYSHAAVWLIWALVELGAIEDAVGLLSAVLPIGHAATREAAERYRVEPYAVAADVYAVPPWTGRGGWTWYTGAAAWTYRLLVERILGVCPEGAAWRLDPRIPPSWPGFEIVLRDGATSFRIRVDNSSHAGRGVSRLVLDGATIAAPLLPRLGDGRRHEVVVTLG